MAETSEFPGDALREGRRALEGMEGVRLLEDWSWYQQAASWGLRVRLSPNIDALGPIPATSDWYALVDDTYPWGEVIFYPAEEGGITQTFPHQNCNAEAYSDRPWRKGRLCVDTNIHALGRQGYDIEPFEPGQRLYWHLSRVLDWLSEASRDRLVLPGDPFELPHHTTSIPGVVAFVEDSESFQLWQAVDEKHGLVSLSSVTRGSSNLCTHEYSAVNGSILVNTAWGQELSDHTEERFLGAWMALDAVPIIEPWQIPTTWGSLRKACQRQGITLDDHLRVLANHLRDGRSHVLLVGFPVPVRVGDPYCQLHWLALSLPALSSGPKNGFRNIEKGHWIWDRTTNFEDHKQLEWLNTDNWSKAELSGRGKLSEEVIGKQIVILGVGALGAELAEQLVRASAINLTLFDGDDLVAGNLVRHNLSMENVGRNKATELADRLNSVSPHGKVCAISQNFPPSEEEGTKRLRQADVIIDCTGKDEVLYQLSTFDWGSPKLFVSASLGMWANRFFIFSTLSDSFPHEQFINLIRPWLQKDLEENRGTLLPREGTGCWQPVFPARVDDIRMMSSIVIKELQGLIHTADARPELVIFEQQVGDRGLSGVSRIVTD